ncbi:MAG TPA: substrate-binding domain-containing protein [Trueperaceae bacterium]|nr:substrate-binding domain-containing protein [Trueperaceae bacterium]
MRASLGLYTNDVAGVFQRSVISGAVEVVERVGLSVSVVELTARVESAAAAGRLTSGTVGSLVLTNVLGDEALSALVASDHPVTLVSHRAPGLGVPTVMHDNRQGMRQLVEHLVASGRDQFVYVGGRSDQLDGRERERFFREELMRNSLDVPAEHFLVGDFEPAVAAASLTDLIRRERGFDAVVAADYLMAIAAMDALRAAGVAVPDEVSVVGFGDGPEAVAAGLTVASADVVELGRRGARQLLAQVHGERLRGYTVIRAGLIVRDS